MYYQVPKVGNYDGENAQIKILIIWTCPVFTRKKLLSNIEIIEAVNGYFEDESSWKVYSWKLIQVSQKVVILRLVLEIFR